MSNKQIFKEVNWNTCEKTSEFQEHISTHKTLNTKKPLEKYIKITQNRTQEQIDKLEISSQFTRGREKYNMIPQYIRKLGIRIFKKHYKRYTIDNSYVPTFKLTTR